VARFVVAVLVWSVWPARAADAVAGIHTPAASSTNQAGPLARELDDFTKKHTDWLSFGLNRWEPLQESYFGRPLWQYIASLFGTGLMPRLCRCCLSSANSEVAGRTHD
jgi:hypothetical protein